MKRFLVLGCWMVVLAVGTCLAVDGDEMVSFQARDEGFRITTVKNQLDSEVVIRIAVPELGIETVDVNGRTFCRFDLAEAGSTLTPGEPMVPIIGKAYQISPDRAPHVSLQILRTREIDLPAQVLPAQEDCEAEDILSIDTVNQTVYALDHWYPEESIQVYSPEMLRDVRLVPVAFFPVQVNPGLGKARIVEEAELIIRMIDEPSPNTRGQLGPYSPSFDQLYRAYIPNYKNPHADQLDAGMGTGEYYLFIMPDAYLSRCQGFFTWKEQQGFIIDVILLSELGGYTPEHVKSALMAKYFSEERPTYVSIIGDATNFPLYESYDSYMGGYFADDLYYSQMEGDDYRADFFLSRYPTHDPDELTVMLSKIMVYETQPFMGVSAFYKTALMACSGLYGSQQTTKEQTADRLTVNLAYHTIHTMYDWQVSGSENQVSQWINQGVSIINYRGEGWSSGWNPGHITGWHYDRVYALQNDYMTPVVTSIGCGVAMFDAGECFGHAWMAHGTPSRPRGAVAFMGPTYNTRTTINNWIDRGIYRGFCYHDITRSGPAFNYGKMYSHDHFLGTPYMTNDVPTHMREYVLFGNPDLWWRTNAPRNADVYTAWSPASDRDGIVIIDDDGNKVANAQVSFLKDTERRVYVTGEGGGCRVYMRDVSEPIPCTLTGWNLLPVFTTYLPQQEGVDGDILITEVKPDIETTGTAGDKVELYNNDLVAVNLNGWTIGDLDGFDVPFVNQDAILEPGEIAVIEFVGYNGLETVTATSYGVFILSRAQTGMSALEDNVVLRNTEGRVRDSLCYHNGSGIGSTDVSYDQSKLTPPTSPLSMGSGGWWTGPDEVTAEMYESLAIDWSAYAGVGGTGSIKRVQVPGAGQYDNASYFFVSGPDSFGSVSFPTQTSTPVDRLRNRLSRD
ncbi:lamin tail domain-containing protein [bacterium]|nr:lamin tail domain-containing protein [candidate division CSSED10-310 bacterium]